jgi:Tfp pilus assembly protein PilO
MDQGKLTKGIKSAINRYYVAIVIALVLIVLSGGYWFFVKNTVDKIRVVGVTDIENKQLTIDQQQRSLEKLKKLKNQYEALDYVKLTQIQSILPHEAELPYVVMKLKKLVTDNGLVLESVDSGAFTATAASPAATTAAVKKLNLTVSFSGIESYAGLKSFLDQLSGSIPLFELNALSYLPGTSAYTLNLTTYYQ